MINRMNLIHWYYSTDIPPRRNHQPLRLSYRLPPSFAARSLSIPKSAICPAIIFLKIVYLENYYLRINYILVLECMIFFFFFYIFQPDSTIPPPFFQRPLSSLSNNTFRYLTYSTYIFSPKRRTSFARGKSTTNDPEISSILLFPRTMYRGTRIRKISSSDFSIDRLLYTFNED